MHFRLYEDGEDQYLARSMQRSSSGRSCSVEIDLEPGRYTIHIKLMPWRTNDCKTPGEVIEKLVAMDRREKLMSVGQSFDMVHSKGRLREAEASARKDMRKNEWQKSTSKLKHDRYSRQVERMRSRRRAWRIKAEMKRKKEAKAAAKKTSGEDSKPSTDVAATEQRQTPMTPISIDAGDEGSTQAGAEKVAGNSEASNVPMEGEAPALPSVEQSTVESKNESTQTGDEPQVPHKEAPPPDIADEDEDGISVSPYVLEAHLEICLIDFMPNRTFVTRTSIGPVTLMDQLSTSKNLATKATTMIAKTRGMLPLLLI